MVPGGSLHKDGAGLRATSKSDVWSEYDIEYVRKEMLAAETEPRGDSGLSPGGGGGPNHDSAMLLHMGSLVSSENWVSLERRIRCMGGDPPGGVQIRLSVFK